MSSKATAQPLSLKIASGAFLAFWCLIAAFPIVWIAVMSVKSPRDAFAASAWDVITGPATRAAGNGLSLLDIVVGLIVLFLAIRWAFTRLPGLVQQFTPPGLIALGWLIGAAVYGILFVLIFQIPNMINLGTMRSRTDAQREQASAMVERMDSLLEFLS